MGYISTPSGEVDFVNHRKWAIEVKWAPVASNRSKTYLKLEYPMKRIWTQENFLDDAGLGGR